MTASALILCILLGIWTASLHSDLKDLKNELKIVKNKLNKLKSEPAIERAEAEAADNSAVHNSENESTADYSEIYAEYDEQAENQVSASNETYLGHYIGGDRAEPAAQNKYRTAYSQSSKSENKFEELFLGNIFTIIGSFAVIAGCIVFLKLISPYILFTPLMKTAAGFLAGIIITALGLMSKRQTLARFSEILTGTGFSVMFITLYCSALVFHTFSINVCLILSVLFLIAAYITAEKQKTVSMAAIALFGGYSGIICCGFQSGINEIFASIIFLNIVSVIFALRNPEKSAVNFINLIVSFITAAGFMLLNGKSQLAPLCPVILWAVYLAYDFFRKDKSADFTSSSNLLNFLNIAVLILFSLLIFGREEINTGILLLSAGIVYTVLAAVSIIKFSDKTAGYIHSMLLSLFAAAFFLTSGVYTPVIWSAAAVFLAAAAKIYRAEYIGAWVSLYSAAALAALLFTPGIIYTGQIENYTPLVNTRLLGMGIYTASLFSCAAIFKSSKDSMFISKSEIFYAGGITAAALYIIFELNDFITYSYGADVSAARYFAKAAAFSLIGFNYAALMCFSAAKSRAAELFNLLSHSAYWISAAILVFSCFNYKDVSSIMPVINIRTAAYIFAIAVSVYLAKKSSISIVYKYAAPALGFLYITAETIDFAAENYILSIVWIIYAGLITAAGIFSDKSYLKISGICVSIIAVLKIVFFDIAGIEMLYKLIVYITLGAVLMITSFYYSRSRK